MMAPLSIPEQLTRIDQQHGLKRPQSRLSPLALALIGMGVGAALFAAGMATMVF